jgi:hypothetical protein
METSMSITQRLSIAVMVLLLASNWFFARKATARPQTVYGQPACTSYVPTSWGDYVGSSEHYGIVFKDNVGTLRFFDQYPLRNRAADRPTGETHQPAKPKN